MLDRRSDLFFNQAHVKPSHAFAPAIPPATGGSRPDPHHHEPRGEEPAGDSGIRRISAAEYATSRRNAYRVEIPTDVVVDNFTGSLVDVSVGGAAVRFRPGMLPESGLVSVELPGAEPMKMEMVRLGSSADVEQFASLKLSWGDWQGYRAMSLWMFHTPAGAVPQLPVGVPVVASIAPSDDNRL